MSRDPVRYVHNVILMDGPIRVTPLDVDGNPCGPPVTITDRCQVESWRADRGEPDGSLRITPFDADGSPCGPSTILTNQPPIGQDRRTWYVLWCLDCGGDVDMPFTSAEERGRWAAAHTRGTGHDRWRVLDVPCDLSDDR